MRNEELGIRNYFLVFAALIIFTFTGAAFASELIDSGSLNIRNVEKMNMSGIMPNYKGTGSFNESDMPEINLTRMKSMNPDFTTYPDEFGIIWQKYVDIEHSGSALEITRLYVILGRRGLDKKWLTWNIQIPSGGDTEILLSDVYDFSTLRKLDSAVSGENPDEGLKTLKFGGLPENFILTVAWKEILPQKLSVEGLCWFQEDLRVWESIVDIHSAQELKYQTFPARYPSETEYIDGRYSYTWRMINVDPYVASGELARLQRQGVIFGTRTGTGIIAGVLKEIENVPVSAPSEAGDTPQKIINWLMKKPEIDLAEGTARKIPLSPAASPLTKREKLLIAKSWFNAKNFSSSLNWQLPFEPEEDTPFCADMFFSPVIEYKTGKSTTFHDMKSPELLTGAKIFMLNTESTRLISRRIPSSKSGANRLSAIMELQLGGKGLINGTVRVILRGAWYSFVMGSENPNDDEIKSAVLSLFPNLKNYSDVNFKLVKGVPELSFKVENMPGVAGSGKGILAVIPFFEPVAMRKLGAFEAPVEIVFPFIADQNITLTFPDKNQEALLSGKVARSPDKINYSQSYTNRRQRLIAEARIEVALNNVTSGNMTTLKRCLDQWRMFSARNIPVR